jgi:hypothetical protein
MVSPLVTGITDYPPLPSTLDDTESVRQRAEAIIAGIWLDFEAACRMSIAVKDLASKNKTSQLRKDVGALTRLAEAIAERMDAAAPATQMVLSAVGVKIRELRDQLGALQRGWCDQLPEGRQPAVHRDLLARDIALAMKRLGCEPKLNRDISTSLDHPESIRGGDSSYAQLVRIGIRIVDGCEPLDVYPHLDRGLAQL